MNQVFSVEKSTNIPLGWSRRSEKVKGGTFGRVLLKGIDYE